MRLSSDQFFRSYPTWQNIKQIWSIPLQYRNIKDIVQHVSIGEWSFILQQWGDPVLSYIGIKKFYNILKYVFNS